MSYQETISIGDRTIGVHQPTYFMADIGSNHDGSLSRAVDLIYLAKEAGADCAKFQHFKAEKIVSDVGFGDPSQQVSHQAGWERSVFDTYDHYHTHRDWTHELVAACKDAEIDFMTTPYDIEAVEMFDDIVPAFKVGSGDITFATLLERISKTQKPVLLATGASAMDEVEAAVELVLRNNTALCLMQCNTNYTGSVDNFAHLNLNVLRTFSERWPGMPLGLSDHTPGHSAVLGAVVLGARIIEKHFTDDNSRKGPDHPFAMNPVSWRTMVDATRELELALGDGVKRVEANEQDTVIVQRRALRLTRPMEAGSIISPEDIEALRPCPPGAISPRSLGDVLGKQLVSSKGAGEDLRWDDLRSSCAGST